MCRSKKGWCKLPLGGRSQTTKAERRAGATLRGDGQHQPRASEGVAAPAWGEAGAGRGGEPQGPGRGRAGGGPGRGSGPVSQAAAAAGEASTAAAAAGAAADARPSRAAASPGERGADAAGSAGGGRQGRGLGRRRRATHAILPWSLMPLQPSGAGGRDGRRAENPVLQPFPCDRRPDVRLCARCPACSPGLPPDCVRDHPPHPSANQSPAPSQVSSAPEPFFQETPSSASPFPPPEARAPHLSLQPERRE